MQNEISVLADAAAVAPATLDPKKKLFIRTFGCQMNEYDSDKMADILDASEASGYEKTTILGR